MADIKWRSYQLTVDIKHHNVWTGDKMEREQDCRSNDKQREAINVTGALVYRICNLVCALYLKRIFVIKHLNFRLKRSKIQIHISIYPCRRGRNLIKLCPKQYSIFTQSFADVKHLLYFAHMFLRIQKKPIV